MRVILSTQRDFWLEVRWRAYNTIYVRQTFRGCLELVNISLNKKHSISGSFRAKFILAPLVWQTKMSLALNEP